MNIYGCELTIATPSHVFGDGQHETTRFLLYFLNKYVSKKTVIDAGCGSGILSIFAAKRGATVTAVDCDKDAISCTLENCAANDVQITAIQSDITRIDAHADIVVANFARFEAMYLLSHIDKLGDMIITTWYKDIPKEPLTDYAIIECIEGVEYDCYVLRDNT